MRISIAYKGFDKDLKCRGFQYEIGKTYELSEKPVVCKKGFHCCTKLSDVFEHYPLWHWSQEYVAGAFRWKNSKSSNRFCLVEVLGEFDIDPGIAMKINKLATNKIKIVRELSIEDMIEILEKESNLCSTRYDIDRLGMIRRTNEFYSL